ncbi:MAG: hypothetical protein HC802_22075, partial [Caldilineaceae bacterium]|nr:hypothetical protein [Caldilineaceae bacterium]
MTQIGLDAFIDHSEMVAWTTALVDGAPLADVTVELLDADVAGVTAEDGLVTLDLPAQGSPLLVATLGDDTAILPSNTYYWDEMGWQSRPVSDELRWYIFDDRQMYRPGEEVHVKGWTRRVGGKQDGDLSLPAPGGSVRYQVMGPQGNQLVDGVAEMSDLGGFDFVFSLPENANLGYAQIYLTAQGVGGIENTNAYHPFQIQEFRRPEFEVQARNDEEGPFFVGDETTVSVEAKYFAGGPLPNAETNWNVTSSPGSYSPPNWPDFVFGEWIPWWGYYDYNGGRGGESYQSFTGKTDASGAHYLRMTFDAATEPRPYAVRAEAVVEDVNRQAWASSTSLLVHPSELYVGIRSDRTFVESGVPLEIFAIVTDLDGNAQPDRTIQMQAARLEWKYEKREWREEEVDVQECTVQSGAEPVLCSFETPMGGEYRITATVEDDQGRANLSRFQRWVSGGKQPPSRNVELEQVTLIPDRETHQPGDVAEILVQAPFAPAEGLLTVSRSGILYTERFFMDESTFTLRVPIEEAHIPNLNIQVDLTGSAPRTDDAGEPIAGAPPRPAFASGNLNLTIPPLSRTLALEVSPQASELEPGAETTIDIQLTDAAGNPVADAEVALVVVDEAILALTGYQLADPVATFYQERGADTRATYGRSTIVLANPDDLLLQVQQDVSEESLQRGGMLMESATAAPAATPAMNMVADLASMDDAADGDAGADSSSPIEVRSNFDPLAVFAPAVQTDANGHAEVPVKLPDNLTRYRIMAVAVAGGQHFGSGESNLTARLPLMVRPAAPRFLNFGDYFELPIVLQNQTDEPMEVDVVLKSVNLLLTDGSGQRVSVPANDRVEVRFPASTVNAGTARLQVAAVSGAYADGAEIELPVYTPATTEAFATYGVIDEGAIVQPVAAPTNVFPQFGSLDINSSSTALQALTDAVLYLTAYPFECSEQLASRILGVASLRDVLSAFEAEGLPSPDEMEAAVSRDIERLQQMQNWDGGFPIWRKGQKSIPFYSIHATHALQRAHDKGFFVPEEMRLAALDHLRTIEQYYEPFYGQMTRQTLSAYALYVRQLMGDVDTAKARTVYAELPLEEQSA